MKLQKSRHASRRTSRQNRKERKSRKYKGGFVRGTSPILNARAFSGASAWNRPAAQVQPAAQVKPVVLPPSAKGVPVLPARSIPVPVAIKPSQVLPVGPNNYRPFASTIQSTYRPYAQGR
jgi:hypothetical protein